MELNVEVINSQKLFDNLYNCKENYDLEYVSLVDSKINAYDMLYSSFVKLSKTYKRQHIEKIVKSYLDEIEDML